MKTLINLSAAPVLLADFHGLELAAGESVDSDIFGVGVAAGSTSVVSALTLSTLGLVVDGTTLTGLLAVSELLVGTPQRTRDNKPIYLSSDRPKDHYRCFGGAADSAAKRWDGSPFVFDVAPGATVEHIADFNEDVYIRDGHAQFNDAGLGATMDISVFAPAGVTLPNGVVAPVDITLYRFLANVLIFGTREYTIDTPEPFLMSGRYAVRMKVTQPADAEKNLRMVINYGIYRSGTV